MPSAFDSVDLPWSLGFPGGSVAKNLLAMQEMQVQCLGQQDPLEEGMATHYRILAWEIPWAKEPGRLESMGSPRVRQDLAVNTFTFSLLWTIWQ